MTTNLTHLQRLEAESIHIIREVVAEAEKPVMLYSVGKDSAVMLHLARKAFYPSPPPFPLLHVDTTWKFQEMYKLRDRMAQESGDVVAKSLDLREVVVIVAAVMGTVIPLVAVPAVLLSQAFGGFAASLFHHHYHNVTWHPDSRDFKIVFLISTFGVLATVLAALIAIHIPKLFLEIYIGGLVFLMGILVLLNRRFNFSWKKMIGVGILSAFNKGLSGGGFGPVVTSGQIMAGQDPKGAVGVTTLAEAPICIMSFLTYLIARTAKEINGPLWDAPVKDVFAKMFSPQLFHGELILALLIGSLLVAPFGPFLTKKIDNASMHVILGIVIIALGLWTLIRALGTLMG